MARIRPGPIDGNLADTELSQILGLLVEYTEKLKAAAEEMWEINKKLIQLRADVTISQQVMSDVTASRQGGEASRRGLEFQHKAQILQQAEAVARSKIAFVHVLLPAAQKVAQYCSQLLEQAVPSAVDRVTLGMRLAEFEGAIRTLREIHPI